MAHKYTAKRRSARLTIATLDRATVRARELMVDGEV
jgi:hypothetical protein